MPRQYQHSTIINAPAEFAFAWHERLASFQRLIPPWEDIRVEERAGGVRNGGRTVFQIRIGVAWQRWNAEHFGYIPGRQFCDRQTEGPFRFWEHVHRFEPLTETSCRMEDHVEYKPPLENLIPSRLIESKIRRGFTYRTQLTKNDIERHYAYQLPPKRILITGASGLIGSHLVPFLEAGGHEVVRLTRSGRHAGRNTIVWNPRTGFADDQLTKLEGFDAVINLAGESIFGLWTEEKRRRIKESRVNTTRRLSEALAKIDRKPEVLISSSAAGIYGNRGDEELTEQSLDGRGFLAEVARAWEDATVPAESAGIRVVKLRTTIVLTPRGGALGTMLRPFQFGAGGRFGSGRQYMSWITIDDFLYLILHCIARTSLRGPVNASSPAPVTNAEFVRTLARILNRPAVMHVPSFIIRRTMGLMGEEVLLSSERVLPRTAEQSGFHFTHPRLQEAFRHVLGRQT